MDCTPKDMRITTLVAATLLVCVSAVAAEIQFQEPENFPDAVYPLIAEQRIVWFGELHGTEEAPRLFLGLVRLVSKKATPPAVALEIPASDQPVIDRYLARGDEVVLKETGFFSNAYKDGRSSLGMARLLRALRKEKIAGVVCFDAHAPKSAQDRDSAMANKLTKVTTTFPTAKLLVLSGNFHSRIVGGAGWDPDYKPAAFQLLGKHSLVSLTLGYESGTAWFRTAENFSLQKVQGERRQGSALFGFVLYNEIVRGHHGMIFSRTVSGSPAWE